MSSIPDEQCFRFFSEIIALLKTTNQHERVLALIVDRIVRTFHSQTCAVVLIDPKTEYLSIDNYSGLSLTFCNSFRRRIATAAIGQLLWTGKPVVIGDADGDRALAEEMQLEHPFCSCVAVQIGVNNRTLGYLQVEANRLHAFSEHDVRLVQLFGDIAGLALMKSKLMADNLRLERVDPETDLEKYNPFLEKLETAADRARRTGEPFTLMLLDVDNFKDLVNTYGYDRSRAVLREMAQLVKERVFTIDACGRYGFDEFIILKANTGLDAGIMFARELLYAIELHPFTQQMIHSTVSAGLASCPQNGHDAEDLILTAKKALYEAQRRGRNTVYAFQAEWYAAAARLSPRVSDHDLVTH
jgi:diguanylate cyclase (GGDEF)-like protein